MYCCSCPFRPVRSFSIHILFFPTHVLFLLLHIYFRPPWESVFFFFSKQRLKVQRSITRRWKRSSLYPLVRSQSLPSPLPLPPKRVKKSVHVAQEDTFSPIRHHVHCIICPDSLPWRRRWKARVQWAWTEVSTDQRKKSSSGSWSAWSFKRFLIDPSKYMSGIYLCVCFNIFLRVLSAGMW